MGVHRSNGHLWSRTKIDASQLYEDIYICRGSKDATSRLALVDLSAQSEKLAHTIALNVCQKEVLFGDS